MSYVKSVCGFLINTYFNINEGEIVQVDVVDLTAKKWVAEGKLVVFDTYEEAVAHTFTPSHVLAAQSLLSLNPGVDSKGNDLVAPEPSFDFEKEAPIVKKVEPVVPSVNTELTNETKTGNIDDKKK